MADRDSFFLRDYFFGGIVDAIRRILSLHHGSSFQCGHLWVSGRHVVYCQLRVHRVCPTLNIRCKLNIREIPPRPSPEPTSEAAWLPFSQFSCPFKWTK